MAKLTYTKVTGQYYSHYTDEWFEDGIDFEYEPDQDELMQFLVDLVYNDNFDRKLLDNENPNLIKQGIKSMIIEHDLEDRLVEYYRNDLIQEFEEKAFDSLCE